MIGIWVLGKCAQNDKTDLAKDGNRNTCEKDYFFPAIFGNKRGDFIKFLRAFEADRTEH